MFWLLLTHYVNMWFTQIFQTDTRLEWASVCVCVSDWANDMQSKHAKKINKNVCVCVRECECEGEISFVGSFCISYELNVCVSPIFFDYCTLAPRIRTHPNLCVCLKKQQQQQQQTMSTCALKSSRTTIITQKIPAPNPFGLLVRRVGMCRYFGQ